MSKNAINQFEMEMLYLKLLNSTAKHSDGGKVKYS